MQRHGPVCSLSAPCDVGPAAYAYAAMQSLNKSAVALHALDRAGDGGGHRARGHVSQAQYIGGNTSGTPPTRVETTSNPQLAASTMLPERLGQAS